MITIDLSDLFLYLIPFIVIWFIVHKMMLKNDDKKDRMYFSLLFSIVIYWAIIMTYNELSQLNFKIQL